MGVNAARRALPDLDFKMVCMGDLLCRAPSMCSRVVRKATTVPNVGCPLAGEPPVLYCGSGAEMWAFHHTRSAFLWPPTTTGDHPPLGKP